MKKLTRIQKMVAAFAAMCTALSMAHAELAIGTSMPMTDYSMTNVDGKSLTLADVKGEKGTVVVFWCNHCPWVVKWRPRFNDIVKDYSGKGFGFVAVNSNDPTAYASDSLEAMKKIAAELDFAYPYVVDEGSKLATAYGATKTPHVYVFDADNKLVYVGAIDDNAESVDKVKNPYLRNVLTALSDGQAIAKNTSKAMGCGIKYYKN